MELRIAIGAAALAAATVCAAADFSGSGPQSPHASIAQAISAPPPPECPAAEPPRVTCAPQQTVTLPPPAKKRSTIVVNPPKVEVQLSCPERPPLPPAGGTGATVVQTVQTSCCDKPPARYESIVFKPWIAPLSISLSPSLSISLAVALSLLLPFVAMGADKRFRRRARKTK